MPSGFVSLNCWARLVRGISEFQGVPTLLIRNTENHISVLHRSWAAPTPRYDVHVSLQETDQLVCHEGDIPRVQMLLGRHTPWHMMGPVKMCQGLL